MVAGFDGNEIRVADHKTASPLGRGRREGLLCKYNSRLCVSVKTLGRARKAASRGHRYEIAVVDEGS